MEAANTTGETVDLHKRKGGDLVIKDEIALPEKEGKEKTAPVRRVIKKVEHPVDAASELSRKVEQPAETNEGLVQEKIYKRDIIEQIYQEGR